MPEETQVIDILQATCRNLNAGRVMFSRFRLERELGRGGMAVVWLARDLEFDSEVALKFLPGLVTDPVAERGLREEVKHTHTLVHENIVRVRDLRKDDTSIAIDMEYVDGPKVSQLIAETPNCWLEPEAAAPLVRGLCRAIDYAFNEPPNKPRRLVHRDIKPLNLMVNSAGVVKVVDFGIAHSVSETIARLTNSSNPKYVVGTLPYMSPQQLKGDIHHLNDVYAIGATIFELLTGTPPFRARDVATLTSQINNDPPPSMTERRRQLLEEKNRRAVGSIAVPRLWEETVAACLAKDPAQRPQGAREIARRLGLVAEGPTHAPFSTQHRVRPSWAGILGAKKWTAGLAAALLVLAAVGVWYFRPSPPSPAKDTAPSVATPAGQSTTTTTTPPPVVTAPAVERTAPTVIQPAESAPAEPAPALPAPAPVPAPPEPRVSWQLVADRSTAVTVSGPEGKVLFQGVLNPGEKQTLPVDQPLLIEAKEGDAIAFEIDGQSVKPPAATSGRWEATVPSAPTASLAAREAPPPPPPFEAEVGPLVKSGQINQLESDWLRQALGGEKSERERALVTQLFAITTPLTVMQWRSRTEMEFKPTREALTSSDPAVQARAIDLTLPPGRATMRLLRLDPGTFNRGAAADEVGRRPSDQPLAPAKVARGFFIGKFEVTQAQFESVLKRSPSYWRGNPTWPVDQVTWYNDLTGPTGFITRLNSELARMPGNILVADLPSEDEWEYACRAGTTTAFNSGEPIKNLSVDPALTELAVYNRPPGSGPRPVGSLKPNAWGLYDMHGNLQEWTQERFVRGGSWESRAAACRAAARSQMSREAGGSNQTGFRLVLRIRETTP